MKNKRKWIWETLFFLIVMGATVYGVFHGEDLGQSIEIISRIRKIYLIPAVFCVIFFIWGESIIIHYLMKTLNFRLKKRTCFLFSSVGFFFSCITPSASGGQPAQVYYMRQKDIPVPVSTVVLMIVTITYKMVLVIIGILMLLFGRNFLHWYLDGVLPVFYLGIVLNVLCVVGMIALVYQTGLVKSILDRLLAFLERCRMMKYREGLHKRLDASMEKYHETAGYLKKHHRVVVNVLLISFGQRIALFLSTYFVYRAFGLHEFRVLTIVLLQAAISISVDMLPLPGGMGISEKLFLTIFLPVFGSDLILPGMILSRGLSYYTELVLCALLTMVAHLVLRRKEADPPAKY